MAYLGGRNHVYHATLQPQPCTQDRHHAHLSGGSQLLAYALAHRSLDFHILQRKIPGDFISHQHADFLQQLAEILGAGLLHAHDSQLVLNQRMINHSYLQICHFNHSFKVKISYHTTKPEAKSPRPQPVIYAKY